MKVILLGASGHGKVVAGIVNAIAGLEVAGFVDDDEAKAGQTVGGIKVVGRSEVLLHLLAAGIEGAIVTIGRNSIRMTRAEALSELGFELVTAIHPAAVLAIDVTVEAGTVVMAGVVINASTRIGRNVIVNTGATVDHDCVLEDGCHVSPGTHLAGGVHVGKEAHVGIGSSVIQGVRIGERSVVGAGAVVIRDVPPGETWAGIPASQIRASSSKGHDADR